MIIIISPSSLQQGMNSYIDLLSCAMRRIGRLGWQLHDASDFYTVQGFSEELRSDPIETSCNMLSVFFDFGIRAAHYFQHDNVAVK